MAINVGLNLLRRLTQKKKQNPFALFSPEQEEILKQGAKAFPEIRRSGRAHDMVREMKQEYSGVLQKRKEFLEAQEDTQTSKNITGTEGQIQSTDPAPKTPAPKGKRSRVNVQRGKATPRTSEAQARRNEWETWAANAKNIAKRDANNIASKQFGVGERGKAFQKVVNDIYAKDEARINARVQQALQNVTDKPVAPGRQQLLPLDFRSAGLKRAPVARRGDFSDDPTSTVKYTPSGDRQAMQGDPLPYTAQETDEIESLLRESQQKNLGRHPQAPVHKGLEQAEVTEHGGITTRTAPSGRTEIQVKRDLAGKPVYKDPDKFFEDIPGATAVTTSGGRKIPGLAKVEHTPTVKKFLKEKGPTQRDLLDPDAATRLRDPNVLPDQPLLDEVTPTSRLETTPRDITPKKSRRASDFFLSANEYSSIKSALLRTATTSEKYQDLVIFDVAAVTGLRNESLRLLKWSDINFTTKRLELRKEIAKAGKGTNIIGEDLPLTDEIIEELTRLRSLKQGRGKDLLPHDDDFIFTRGNTAEALGSLRNPIRRAGESIGLNGLAPHMLRHFAATARGLGGATDEAVKNALLHTSKTTARDAYYPTNFDDILESYRRGKNSPGYDSANDIYAKLAALPEVQQSSRLRSADARAQAVKDLPLSRSFLNEMGDQVRRAAGFTEEQIEVARAGGAEANQFTSLNEQAINEFYRSINQTTDLRDAMMDPNTGLAAGLSEQRFGRGVEKLRGEYVKRLHVHYTAGGELFDNLNKSVEALPSEYVESTIKAVAEVLASKGVDVRNTLNTPDGQKMMRVFLGYTGQREVMRSAHLELLDKFGSIISDTGRPLERFSAQPKLSYQATERTNQMLQTLSQEPTGVRIRKGRKRKVAPELDDPAAQAQDRQVEAGMMGQLLEAMAANDMKQFHGVFTKSKGHMKQLNKATSLMLFMIAAMQMPEGMMS